MSQLARAVRGLLGCAGMRPFVVAIAALAACGTEDSGDSGSALDAGDGDGGASFCDRDGDGSDGAAGIASDDCVGGFQCLPDACSGDDCDDSDASVHPGATDSVGDYVDQSCDGIDGVDEDGDRSPSIDSGGLDCDDSDASVPGPEVAGDGIDQDCDGIDAVDGDGDGFVSIATSGDDCDDADPAVFPGAQGDWLREVVDGSSNNPPSVAIDLLGAAHVAYTAGQGVRYATHDAGEWILSDIDPGQSSEGRPELKVDEDGAAHIAYQVDEQAEYSDTVLYASNASGSWAIEEVGGVIDSDWSLFGPFALAIGVDREPNVVLVNRARHLVHAVRRDEVWELEVIATVVGEVDFGSDPALAIDAAGALHVSYTEFFNDQAPLLRYASNVEGRWSIGTIHELGIWGHLALSASGIAHTVYAYVPNDCNLNACDTTPQHATYVDGTWETEDIEGFGDFAVDEAGALHVSSNNRYLTNTGGGWSREELFAFGRELSDLMHQCALALDPDGLPHLACGLAGDDIADDEVGIHHIFRGIPDARDDDCDGVAW